MNKHEAGYLRERMDVLELVRTPDGWAWRPCRRVWAGVELTGKSNLFSAVGIGARAAEVVLRRQCLSLHQMLGWRGQKLFLTRILETDRGWMDVDAAVVTVVDCRVRSAADTTLGKANRPVRAEAKPVQFPGVLTERYLGNQKVDEGTYKAATDTLVLVTPKAVELNEGNLVDILSGPAAGIYCVDLVHRLDQWKNEYEITRKKDV